MSELIRFPNVLTVHHHTGRNDHLPERIHSHTVDELVIVKNSVSTILTDSNIYKIDGAFAVFYPAGLVHQQLNAASLDYDRYLINYPRSLVEELVPPDILPHFFFVIPLRPDEQRQLQTYIELMLTGDTTDAHLTTCRYLLAIILHQLAPLFRTRLASSDWKPIVGAKQVHDICCYINENLSEPLTLDSIAHTFFISRAKLVRIFRNVMGMSVKDYVTYARVSKSKQLLRRGVSVQDAADQCGFSTASYFIRVFRQITNMTPAEYKKN